MTITRSPGITIGLDGKRIINKEYRGARLFIRLGNINQDHAEKRLRTEIERINDELERKAHARPLFQECAARYLGESRSKRSLDTITWHVRMLITHIGRLASVPSSILCDSHHSSPQDLHPVQGRPRSTAASRSCAQF